MPTPTYQRELYEHVIGEKNLAKWEDMLMAKADAPEAALFTHLKLSVLHHLIYCAPHYPPNCTCL